MSSFCHTNLSLQLEDFMNRSLVKTQNISIGTSPSSLRMPLLPTNHKSPYILRLLPQLQTRDWIAVGEGGATD